MTEYTNKDYDEALTAMVTRGDSMGWFGVYGDIIKSALTRAASPLGWQPIESAPDNKDMVMLWLDGEMWYGRRSFGKWRAKGYKDTFCEPEFWMPLPPPPNNHNREGA